MNKENIIAALDLIKGITNEEKIGLKQMDINELNYIYHMNYLYKEEEIQDISVTESKYDVIHTFYREM